MLLFSHHTVPTIDTYTYSAVVVRRLPSAPYEYILIYDRLLMLSA